MMNAFGQSNYTRRPGLNVAEDLVRSEADLIFHELRGLTIYSEEGGDNCYAAININKCQLFS